MNHEFTLLQSDYTVCSEDWGMTDENALFYRMYYILGGEAYLKKGDQKIRLEPGFFYILPLMKPYTLWHIKEDPLQVLWFHIQIKMDFYIDLGIVKIIENTPMYYILQSLRSFMGQSRYQRETEQLFDIFLTLLNEDLPLQKTDHPAMKSVLDYIDTHLADRITVRDLAAYVGMERSYFSRKFKATFQMSPNQYLYSARLNRAAIALAKGATVSEACQIADYADEKSFSRAFHSYMDISPSTYRKSHIVQP